MFKQYSLLLIVSLGLAACGDSSNKNANPNTPNTDFIALENAAKVELADNNSSAVSIAIYKNGEIVYAKAFGNKKLNGTTEATKDTLFQLGSTTKMLTSLATMSLVDEGMITREDKLTLALPDLIYPDEQASAWQEINIHHLMSHQGGFADTYIGTSDQTQLSGYMLNQYSVNNHLMVSPETFYNYSNPTFSYLGTIIEYYRQQDYEDVMQESVFNRLGMTNSTMQKSDVIENGDYTLGVFEDENGVPNGYTSIDEVPSTPVIKPAGNYTWSTPTDILKMAEFLMNGNADVLSDELRQEMTKKHVFQDFGGLPQHYGYGIFIDDGFIHEDKWYPVKLWHHAGSTEAYSSAFYILPDQNVAVSILSNGYNTDYSKTMLEALRSVTTLPDPVETPWGNLDEATLDKHEGVYTVGPLTIEISNKNGTLELNIPEYNSQGLSYERELESLGEETFLAFVDSEIVELTFFPEVEGEESVYIRNRNFVAIKEGW